ncbi:hypothetical protein K4F52_009550 [Lecanicillium sp. MT-2017a]|nr:hypothetical protein K4F52_009550 [Lecanicillium sp. MT-2017a]
MDTSEEEKPSENTCNILQYINRSHEVDYAFVGKLHGGFAGETCIVQENTNNRQAVLKWDPRVDQAARVSKAAAVVAQARAAGWPTPEWLIQGVAPGGQVFTIQEYIPLASGSHWDISTRLAESAVDFVQRTQAGVCLDTGVNWIDWDWAVVFEDSQECAARLREHSAHGAEFVDLAPEFAAEFRNVKLDAKDIVHGDFQPGNFLLAQGDKCCIEAVVDVEAIGKGTRFHDVADLACHNIIWQGEATILPVLDAYAQSHSEPGEWEVSFVARLYELLCFYIFLFKGDASSRLQSAMTAIEYIKSKRL